MRYGKNHNKKDLEQINGTRESFYTNDYFGMVPRLPVPRLPPGDTLDTLQFWALVPQYI